jgi:hypothetical protein
LLTVAIGKSVAFAMSVLITSLVMKLLQLAYWLIASKQSLPRLARQDFIL